MVFLRLIKLFLKLIEELDRPVDGISVVKVSDIPPLVKTLFR